MNGGIKSRRYADANAAGPGTLAGGSDWVIFTNTRVKNIRSFQEDGHYGRAVEKHMDTFPYGIDELPS
ncbi:uncharacterized protein ARMOST_06113 [Armillaria ostoyae]|uniref:Uncharacterized protein n=1 Tax=Armillaria ostoyae TaxID=47428 RepID=A0A284R222_ARMOS|nr:uncharacterized protein ARMOST_06113 [Armillaria ostoyae]